jgi:oligogalacturonide transport system permease protein
MNVQSKPCLIPNTSLGGSALLLRLKNNIGLLYILPWIVGFLVFMAYPLAASLFYSFTDLSPFNSEMSFVGLDNYIYMFTKDPDFFKSLKVTLLYAFIAVPGRVLFALIIAMILAVNLRGINFFRTAYYLPSIFAGSVAISILWRFLFQKEGQVNNIFEYMFAALKQVPAPLYEAAKLDGASRISTFFRITLPMISPIMLFNLVMQTIACLQEFTSIFVVTSGGPNKATYVYAYKLYLEGFSFFKMGYASALSWILFLIILIFTFLIFKSSKYWTYYEDGGDSK